MKQSTYLKFKSAIIRSIRVIRVPLASIRLCVVAALLLLSLTTSATGNSSRSLWEGSPEVTNEDLHLVPRHSFGEERDLSSLDVESLTETIDKIYVQDENILRAGGTEGGDDGDPTKMPVGSAPGVILALSALYAVRKKRRAV